MLHPRSCVGKTRRSDLTSILSCGAKTCENIEFTPMTPVLVRWVGPVVACRKIYGNGEKINLSK